MGSKPFTITYRIVPEGSSMFCGTGAGRTSVDRTFFRDARDRMIIPGSHVRGITRQHCEDLLQTLGGRPADPHAHKAAASATDIVARVFGRPEDADVACVFDDVVPETPSATVRSVRKRVRIDRRLGRPASNHLFDTEYAVPGGDDLCGKVTLWVTKPGDGIPREVSLICAGLRLVNAIGGDTSTGAGAVRVEILAIESRGSRIDLAAALAPFGEVSW